MADGEGALVAQQKFAAEEPYKNISLGNPAEKFLNAWALSTSVKDRQRQLEQQMMGLQLRNAQFDYDKEFDKKKFGLDVLKAQNEEGYRNAMLGVDAKRLGIEQQNADRLTQWSDVREKQINDQADARVGLFGLPVQLRNEGLKEGSREWKNRYDELAGEYIGKATPSEFNKLWANVHNDQNLAILRQQKVNQNNLRAFKEEVGSELYKNPMFQNLAPIVNPEGLDDETKKDHWLQKEWATNPGVNKKVYMYDPVTGKENKSVYTVKNIKDLKNLQAKWKKLTDQQTQLADPIDDPANNVFSKRVRPMPGSKDQLEVDTPYDVPGRGTMIWTGTGFVPPPAQ